MRVQLQDKTQFLQSLAARALVLACGTAICVSLAACAAGAADAGASAGSPETQATEQQSAVAASNIRRADDGSVTFTDDLGNEVTVNNPQRVVATMGSFASSWQLAGGSLTAATDDAFENYGVDSSSVASVGRSTALSLESILAQEPDFVIATGLSTGRHSTGVSQDDLKAALDASGVPVAFFTVTTFDDYLRMLGVFTAITGRDDLYQENGAEVQERVEQAIAQYGVAGSAPSVLVVSAYSKGLVAQDSTGMTGAMLADLGASNIVDENPSLLDDLSLEAVAEIDPDYIFVLPAGRGSEAEQQNLEAAVGDNAVWQNLTAVKEGRLVVLDSEHFLYKPNEKWDESYVTLGQALAGE